MRGRLNLPTRTKKEPALSVLTPSKLGMDFVIRVAVTPLCLAVLDFVTTGGLVTHRIRQVTTNEFDDASEALSSIVQRL